MPTSQQKQLFIKLWAVFRFSRTRILVTAYMLRIPSTCSNPFFAFQEIQLILTNDADEALQAFRDLEPSLGLVSIQTV